MTSNRTSLKKVNNKLVHMNFVVSEELRNSFRAKLVSQGKTVKDVFEAFMKEYLKSNL